MLHWWYALMTRKTYSFNLDIDTINKIDQFVINPCSRSDLVESLLTYALQNSYILSSFVQTRLDEIKTKVDSIERVSQLQINTL